MFGNKTIADMKYGSDEQQSLQLKKILSKPDSFFPTPDMVLAVYSDNRMIYRLKTDCEHLQRIHYGAKIVESWSLSIMISAIPPFILVDKNDNGVVPGKYNLHICPGGKEFLSNVYYADECGNKLPEFDFYDKELLDAVFLMIMHVDSTMDYWRRT